MTLVADFSRSPSAQKGFEVRVEKKLGLASIVLLAQNHNPSILSPEFLSAKKIVEGTPSNFAHTQVVSVVEYADKQLSINVTPDRFTVNFGGNINDKSVEEMVRIVSLYFTCLPETPVTAVGINFHGELTFRSEDEMAGFQEAWFKPSRLSESLKGLKVNWGSTARFLLPESKALVTLKIEPGANPGVNPLSITFAVNGHYDVKGTTASIGVLRPGAIDLLAFSSKMMSEL